MSYIKRDKDIIEIGNEFIARRFDISNNRFATKSIINKRTKNAVELIPCASSEEFAVSVLGRFGSKTQIRASMLGVDKINEFEKELYDWGAVIIKFWVQIDKDVQLERFTFRQNTPEKQWKITDEDWRNREKWDLYEEAVDEMLQKTNTTYAPWFVLESNDKKYARIKALKTIIQEIEKNL